MSLVLPVIDGKGEVLLRSHGVAHGVGGHGAHGPLQFTDPRVVHAAGLHRALQAVQLAVDGLGHQSAHVIGQGRSRRSTRSTVYSVPCVVGVIGWYTG